MSGSRKLSGIALLGPGILLAATGVGAGDLATAAFTGHHLGLAVLWVVIVGAALKFVLNEGLARWQLASGQSFLEGAIRHLGRPFQLFFIGYLLLWSFFAGSALVSACGAAAHALIPVFDSARNGKIVFGLLHSLAGGLLVYRGGYRLFERVMGLFIGLMFVSVVATAILVEPDWGEFARGISLPRIPDYSGSGLSWVIALMGGVGGTLTVLCYGYWIKEEGRNRPEDLRSCRIDLAGGYLMTAVFGLAMVVIGSRIQVEGQGAGLVVALAEHLRGSLGTTGKWIFLLGAWGAVTSSLLGVWQSVPYLFADFWRMRDRRSPANQPISTRSKPYLAYLVALALIPCLGLSGGFQQVQKLYAIVGAAFMPVLALSLLYLNGSSRRVGQQMRNHPLTSVLLVAVLAFFAWAGWLQLTK